ncbi:MAG TPA: sodium-dependent transporter [bacterium (Candidatus Stahlbacteria)]|nr:sodium-dependent transporter [Candidatus Stahlbacteria bacterium]
MREKWNNRGAFILAAIGSAIGLGNVWRFPYICFKNGGGAFLIPYLIALLTTGIPLMILEFSLGHKFAASAPSAFRKLSRYKGWVGWFALLVAFGIVSYYAVIMAWSFDYLGYSFRLSWGKDTESFFINTVLARSSGPFELGNLRVPILVGLLLTWIAIIGCVWKGPKTVGKVVYVTVILPWLILIAFVIRGITLPGAVEGLKYYLTPDFAALRNPQVWLAAYSQIFFTLTLGFGVMIAYASYLPRDSDIINNAFIVSLANCGTSFLAGFAVFSTLGYYSYCQNVPVPEVISSGIGLAFITYPTIINLLPIARQLFGILFFLMLLTLGIDSAFSLVEAGVAGIMDKWQTNNRVKINVTFGIVAFIVGIIYTTGGGLYWLDIVDHFMSNFGLVIVAILECVILGYMYRLSELKNYANKLSEFGVGIWWDICIKVISPIVLTLLIVLEVVDRVKGSYGGYPRSAEVLGGWLVLVAFFGIAIFLNRLKGSED